MLNLVKKSLKLVLFAGLSAGMASAEVGDSKLIPGQHETMDDLVEAAHRVLKDYTPEQEKDHKDVARTIILGEHYFKNCLFNNGKLRSQQERPAVKECVRSSLASKLMNFKSGSNK